MLKDCNTIDSERVRKKVRVLCAPMRHNAPKVAHGNGKMIPYRAC